MNIKDKVCIITSAANGVGMGLAERFIADGALVAIADISVEAAKASTETLTAKGPGRAIGLAVDVPDEARSRPGGCGCR